MAGKGNPMPGGHLNGFPMSTYSYFFPHMLGSLSPPALPGLPISGYSTPSPARSNNQCTFPSQNRVWTLCHGEVPAPRSPLSTNDKLTALSSGKGLF
ncbi:unnamed protein product [Menidia menidia]|uniref:(Atlantic silverside) hypothetical protein n=1 Tax=Menidia menidia TaxID=238744 RepID=A0A8S4B8A1_9TELE|nr:unnamed protein product [Menidia menidia]